ncbi:hypothetical protein [Streptomyces swartbergensis]|nr:hypothetical protein [Streptomyces swartbergensis]
MIQSLEAPARGPLPDPPGREALYKAMLRAGQRAPTPAPGKGG